jgi:hypothetical protein
VQLFIFGGFNSMQFTAMNSVTLKDMEGESASSGNSLLSMVQMLAMSMGGGAGRSPADGFSDMCRRTATSACRPFAPPCDGGLMTLAATLVFSQLDADEHVRPARMAATPENLIAYSAFNKRFQIVFNLKSLIKALLAIDRERDSAPTSWDLPVGNRVLYGFTLDFGHGYMTRYIAPMSASV